MLTRWSCLFFGVEQDNREGLPEDARHRAFGVGDMLTDTRHEAIRKALADLLQAQQQEPVSHLPRLCLQMLGALTNRQRPKNAQAEACQCSDRK